MVRHIVLIQFTDRGIGEVKDSPDRAAKFREAATRFGVTVEAQYWTLGAYDGVLVLSAPDEATATAAILSVAKQGYVRTCMLRAFDAPEFTSIVGKVP